MEQSNPLDFKINIEKPKLDQHIEPDNDITVDKYDAVYQHHEEDSENQQKELIIQEYDIRQAAHPLICLGQALISALPCLCFIFSNHYLYTYLFTMTLQLSAFLYTKNIGAHKLVGLKWRYNLLEWSFINEDIVSNRVDSAFFWTTLFWSNIFWGVMAFLAGFMWFPLTSSCLMLCLLNSYGFYKCRGAHQQKLQKLKSEMAKQGMNIVGMIMK